MATKTKAQLQAENDALRAQLDTARMQIRAHIADKDDLDLLDDIRRAIGGSNAIPVECDSPNDDIRAAIASLIAAAEHKAELVKKWKVRTSASGAVLTINGKSFELGASGHSIAFEIERAASGYNAPETERAAL